MASVTIDLKSAPIVLVSHLCLTYDKNEVLKNACLTVPKGGIYALLGPSGCGKTTLIKCIVGQLTPQSGSVTVCGQKPGSVGSDVPGAGVGYMPQEDGLFASFTIEETLMYFAKLNGNAFRTSDESLKTKIVEITKLLELPSTLKLVGELSGGEKKRVSLAITLVNDAPLLILDEPTVGVDILLSKKIWRYLIKLTTEKQQTVMVTTHYISEANDANIVAFMRGGQIISETSPQSLFSLWNAKTLEQAFLKMCKTRNFRRSVSEACSEDLLKKAQCHEDIHASSLKSQEIFTNKTIRRKLARIKAHIWKSYITEKHHKYLVVLKAGIVLFQALVFPLVFGGEPFSLSLDVFNADNDSISSDFLASLHKRAFEPNLIESVNKLKELRLLSTFRAAIRFRSNYTSNVFNFDDIAEEDGCIPEYFQFDVYADVSDTIIKYELEKQLHEAFNRTRHNFAARNQTLTYFATSEQPYHKIWTGDGIERTTKDLYIVNCFTMYIFFIGYIASAIQLQVELANGFLERGLVAGLTIGEMFVSFAVGAIPHTVIQSILLQICIITVFGVHVTFSDIQYIFAMQFLMGLSATGFGLFIGAISPNITFCAMMVIPSYVILGVFTGAYVSAKAFPAVVNVFSKFFYPTQSFLAVRYVLFKQWPAHNFYVLMGIVSPVLGSIFFFVLSYWVLRKRIAN